MMIVNKGYVYLEPKCHFLLDNFKNLYPLMLAGPVLRLWLSHTYCKEGCLVSTGLGMVYVSSLSHRTPVDPILIVDQTIPIIMKYMYMMEAIPCLYK
jgi:hypothetical protein